MPPAASEADSAGGADSAGALGAAVAEALSPDAAGALEEPEWRDRERRPAFGSGVGSVVAADEGESAVMGSPLAAVLGGGLACRFDVPAVLGAVTGAEEPAFSPGV
jgi:hypothetical protein